MVQKMKRYRFMVEYHVLEIKGTIVNVSNHDHHIIYIYYHIVIEHKVQSTKLSI